MNTRTVEKYLDLLEKVFVISASALFEEPAKGNLQRLEILFWDNGIQKCHHQFQ
ncbi:MAG: hypothetical protein IPI11_05310 [Haliscomenobacter sp.]|nr:hypothetical protein [Haliscomenobacter sp.]